MSSQIRYVSVNLSLEVLKATCTYLERDVRNHGVTELDANGEYPTNRDVLFLFKGLLDQLEADKEVRWP